MYGDLKEQYENEVQNAPLRTHASHMKVIKNLMCGDMSVECAASLFGSWYFDLDKWKCKHDCWDQWSDLSVDRDYPKPDIHAYQAPDFGWSFWRDWNSWGSKHPCEPHEPEDPCSPRDRESCGCCGNSDHCWRFGNCNSERNSHHYWDKVDHTELDNHWHMEDLYSDAVSD